MKLTNWDSNKSSAERVLTGLEDTIRLQRGLTLGFDPQGKLGKPGETEQSKARFLFSMEDL